VEDDLNSSTEDLLVKVEEVEKEEEEEE